MPTIELTQDELDFVLEHPLEAEQAAGNYGRPYLESIIGSHERYLTTVRALISAGAKR